ncbi:aminotransferase class I/II-fold pyridoxal phosphate-dependent enzyme [Paracoccus sp. 11-3]|uniref:Aminotransferase class I/II-fold pyridoxal phosphate-dependent enzyme n=1 Tax=Paracoccus amoyensis TaxID=2760093 RepID=A0A926GBL1_9RHOB|nr:aminotransferase class I/II-fold pyridoxal phosphate-dependent enzyme [Paracoccus amoyensis]MBC9246090.1 aminotransferase class I/II-fold pyridoxal phosphate-dependent enzyme [Paracoccus amoyensis]
MALPERFSNLPDYAFPRLRALLSGIEPGLKDGEIPMVLTIGEPKHAMPDYVGPVLNQSLAEYGKYPPNDGTPELLAAISAWLKRRYGVDIPTSRITSLNGSREGLFNAALALCPEQKNGQAPAILIPNPFYQVYAVAAAAVGAEQVFVPATVETHHLPNFTGLPADVLNRTAIAYLCSPANPQGAIAGRDYLRDLIQLAETHDFLIFADECYSEIYRDEPAPGALEVAADMGLGDRVVVFNSLSKRSSLPGLRSGFVVASEKNTRAIRQLRSYTGAPVPLPNQRVSERAWADEDYVIGNRELYQQKYQIADRIFGNVPGYRPIEGGFFLWLPVDDGEEAAKKLWAQAGIQVLPGAYLSRDVNGHNPGKGYIRVAMVADAEQTEAALQRLRAVIYDDGDGEG